MEQKVDIIAYYLPQFYPTKENNEWWGKGFTEWTNVAKAKKLFVGHYQPKIPSELGFYDLRLLENKEEQVKLAKEAGVSAFCYWHYWLGNDRVLLDKPYKDLIKNGKPDFPFCLGWANHDWEKKSWDSNVSRNDHTLLAKQEYPGIEDYKKHFFYVLPAFKDKRYHKIDGKPFFLIYDAEALPNTKQFIDIWNQLADENGLNRIFFVAHTRQLQNISTLKNMGFELINFSPHRIPFPDSSKIINKIKRRILKWPNVVNYSKAIKVFDHPINYEEHIIPTIIPNWDHTPRSGVNGIVLHKSNPTDFGKHVENTLRSVKHKKHKIIMIKSWNEWGEGNYMEPDLKYGKRYITELCNKINKINAK